MPISAVSFSLIVVWMRKERPPLPSILVSTSPSSMDSRRTLVRSIGVLGVFGALLRITGDGIVLFGFSLVDCGGAA